MPEIAATKDTASMTQAAPHAIMPHGGQNRRAARVQAAALRWLVRLAALLTAAVLVFPHRLHSGYGHPQPEARAVRVGV